MSHAHSSAFPNSGAHASNSPEGGLTIRQYYKAAALQGLLANLGRGGGISQEYAETAGRFADAMLAEDAEFEGAEFAVRVGAA